MIPATFSLSRERRADFRLISRNVLDGGAKLPSHDDLVKVGLVLPLRVQEYVQEHLHSVTVIIERTIVELSDKTYPFVIAHRLFV